mmetsp:Transcript_70886/g.184572  ORF Transcript_70886/g.184572 Transcript_70886/m.184572 type:complete len:244 (-) Transcript_70886:144-875(-)
MPTKTKLWPKRPHRETVKANAQAIPTGPSALANVSSITATPLTSARRSLGTALLVNALFIAASATVIDDANMCKTLATATPGAKGNTMHDAHAMALASIAKRRLPRYSLALGISRKKNRIFQTAERDSKAPTSFSVSANPPTASAEMAHKGSTSKNAKMLKPCNTRMSKIAGRGCSNQQQAHLRPSADSLSTSGLEGFLVNAEAFPSSSLSPSIHASQASNAATPNAAPDMLGAAAGKTGTML